MRSLIKKFGRTIQIERQLPGRYDDKGVWLPGSVSTFDIIASVQHLDTDDLLRLPENQRSKEMIKIFTDVEIFTTSVQSQTTSDIVIIDGYRYEVSKTHDFKQHKALTIRYFRADCVLENQRLA